MKSFNLGKLAILATVLSVSQFTFADTASATKTVAGILANLNHFASDADKATLMAISADESNGRGIRAIASAVHNIQHAATADDKAVMAQIMAADQAPAEVKALADIVANINHMPSAEAKAALQAML